MSPERGAGPLETGERLLERHAGRAALLCSPLRDPLREQGTRVLERILSSRVLGQRAAEARLGARESPRAARRRRAAPGRDRQRPRSVERSGALLPQHELPLCVRELADRDQRFQCVREVQTVARLEYADAVTDLPGTLEVLERCCWIAARELDEAEHPAMARLGDPDAFFLRTCQGALRPNARILDSTLVCRDQRGGKLGDGLLPLAAELRPQLEVVGRMPRPQLPVPRPPLEQAQHPQPGLPGVVPCLKSRALLLEEFPRTIELARPEQLGHERRRRLARQPALRQRPLERERLIHLLACDAAPDPEMQEPESR